MRDYLFVKFREPNPLGTWMKMATAELGIKQLELAALLPGTSDNQVAMMFKRTNQGPSFSSGAGQILIERIAEEERDQWRMLWGKHYWGRTSPSSKEEENYPRYPSSRPRVLRQAAFALSMWNVPEADVRARNREFFELLPMLSPEVYQQTLHMLLEPLYGPVLPKGRSLGRNKIGGKVHEQKGIAHWRNMRRDAVSMVIRAAEESCRDEIFDTEFDELIASDDPFAAFQRAWQRFEGLETQRAEANEVALLEE